jgi:hypothetical protein
MPTRGLTRSLIHQNLAPGAATRAVGAEIAPTEDAARPDDRDSPILGSFLNETVTLVKDTPQNRVQEAIGTMRRGWRPATECLQ